MRTRFAPVAVLTAALLVGARAAPSHALFISGSEEVRIGKDVDRNIVAKYGLSKDTKGNQRLQRIADKVAPQSERHGRIQFHFRLLATDEVNAFAAPGGYVYATDGLLDFVGNDDDALACIVGHEIGHIDRRHGVQNLERAVGAELAIGILFGGESGERLVAVASNLVLLGYSRKQETQADRIGMRHANAAGYDARGLVRFLDKLVKAKGSSSRLETFFQTHPATKERLQDARKYIENKGL